MDWDGSAISHEANGNDPSLSNADSEMIQQRLLDAQKPQPLRAGALGVNTRATSYSPTHLRVQYHRGREA